MDLQKREQLVIVIRYLSAAKYIVLQQREDLVAMLDLVRDVCEQHSEKKLNGVAILQQMFKLGLDLCSCWGDLCL